MSAKGTTLVNTRNLSTTATSAAQLIINSKWAKSRCAILSSQMSSLSKNWYTGWNIYIYILKKKKSKNWYKYAKATYFLDKVTNGL